MVADIYCDLLEASRAGRFVLTGFGLEVERTPANEPIRPDAVIGLERDGITATVLLEAETGLHVLRSLDKKCRAYWRASRA